MVVLGLLLGTIGQDLYTGVPRFTFGVRELYGGLDFVSLAVGMFGVAEIIRNLEQRQTPSWSPRRSKGLWLTREDARTITGPVLRGTTVGSLLGVLPGAGHVLAAFTSYSLEKRISRTPSGSAGAPSRAWPRPSPPTTPPRRRRSSPCSPSACRRIR